MGSLPRLARVAVAVVLAVTVAEAGQVAMDGMGRLDLRLSRQLPHWLLSSLAWLEMTALPGRITR
jgi:hypothetical protein